MARPKAKISESEVFELAKIMCTQDEIASVLGVCRDTINRRFSDIINKGHNVGKRSLRRNQFKMSQKNAAMGIWLGKQYLGQTEKIDISSDDLIEEELEFAGMPKGKVNGKYKRFYN